MECVTIATISSAIISNCTIITTYSIGTFNTHTLNYPVKMHSYGSCLSATSYDIIISE